MHNQLINLIQEEIENITSSIEIDGFIPVEKALPKNGQKVKLLFNVNGQYKQNNGIYNNGFNLDEPINAEVWGEIVVAWKPVDLNKEKLDALHNLFLQAKSVNDKYNIIPFEIFKLLRVYAKQFNNGKPLNWMQ